MTLRIQKIDISELYEYSKHLKALVPEDRHSRFGSAISDHGIDQIMLQIAYHPSDHQLWIVHDYNEILGYGHMARSKPDVWELAVSVEKKHQRKGAGDKLITEMLEWAKVQNIEEVYMHCIEENKVIQHLASKHNLKTKERGYGERTAAIELPDASALEKNNQLFKEYTRLVDEMTELRLRMLGLMLGNTDTTHKENYVK